LEFFHPKELSMSKTDSSIQDRTQRIKMERAYLIKAVAHCRKVTRELGTPSRQLFIKEIPSKICKIKILTIRFLLIHKISSRSACNNLRFFQNSKMRGLSSTIAVFKEGK
jgi:hypothetical protein